MNANETCTLCDTAVRCRHCGHRGNQHRASDGRCPKAADFPKAPTMYPEGPAWEKAEKRWDAAIARHWSARSTSFQPRV